MVQHAALTIIGAALGMIVELRGTARGRAIVPFLTVYVCGCIGAILALLALLMIDNAPSDWQRVVSNWFNSILAPIFPRFKQDLNAYFRGAGATAHDVDFALAYGVAVSIVVLSVIVALCCVGRLGDLIAHSRREMLNGTAMLAFYALLVAEAALGWHLFVSDEIVFFGGGIKVLRVAEFPILLSTFLFVVLFMASLGWRFAMNRKWTDKIRTTKT